MIRISVPCSTSNLGPGFDSLGLALSLSLDVELRPSEARTVTRHGDELFSAVTDADDLFLRALSHRRSALGLADDPFAATLRSAIPTGRGLGSSAAAVVAGVMAADALAGRAHDPIDVLRAATRVEGHPDNAAPAILGGLCCAVVDEDVHAACISSLADVRAVVASPEGMFPTKASRGALPATLDHKAATASLGRAVFLSHALRDGRTDGLAWAFRDAFHQPYRAPLLPGLPEAISAAQQAGAIGAFLSGAGSSSIALVRDDRERVAKVSAAMRAAYDRVGTAVTMRALTVHARGAMVSR
ncbi:MAG: homoserine kinase [Myxococcaceae bacterium]|nr:MAG: homoserine kinase [Myxococcaceae bacterium]